MFQVILDIIFIAVNINLWPLVSWHNIPLVFHLFQTLTCPMSQLLFFWFLRCTLFRYFSKQILGLWVFLNAYQSWMSFFFIKLYHCTTVLLVPVHRLQGYFPHTNYRSETLPWYLPKLEFKYFELWKMCQTNPE